MKNCLGIINISEKDQRLGVLTETRPVAMLPIAGRYRLIDFTLSNLVNSGINAVGVFTKNKTRSILDHLGSGKPWDLDRKMNGLFVFSPTYDMDDLNYRIGDLQLWQQNQNFLRYAPQTHILITKSYMLGSFDYDAYYNEFLDSGADFGIIYKKINENNQNYFGLDKINLNDDGTFASLGTNTGMDDSFNLSLEMYFMRKDLFLEMLNDAVEKGQVNYIKQAIRDILKYVKVHLMEHKGYVSCINSIGGYFKANMDTLKEDISEELFFKYGPVFTKVKDEPPTFYHKSAKVKNSFVANGSIIDGFIENSILFRGVKIEKGCIIRNSIIMQKSTIQKNTHTNYVILDKRTDVSSGVTVVGDPSVPYVSGKKTKITKDTLR